MSSNSDLLIIGELSVRSVQVTADIKPKSLQLDVTVQGSGPVGPMGPPGATYVHPSTHPVGMLVESADRVFLTEAEKTTLLTFKESYTHQQRTVSALWTITHNLNKYPNITVLDSAGTNIIGERTDIDINTVQLRFSAAFCGAAYLS